MAWSPHAVRKPLAHANEQPTIRPVGVVLHTAVSSGSSLYTFFNGRSSGVESHFYVRVDGTVEQYVDTTRRADCQLDGNSWLSGGSRYGFLSVETWDGGHPERNAWNAKQAAAIVDLIAWCARTHGFPIVKATGPHGHGVGWHSQFTDSPSDPGPSWNHSHSCPGSLRIAQVPGLISRAYAALHAAKTATTETTEIGDTAMATGQPAQLVQVKGDAAIYAVTLSGAVHMKNPTHLAYARRQGWVTSDIKQISKADLAALREVEK